MLSSNDLLTTSQVAETLDVSTRTVARLVANQQLAAAVQAPGKRGAFLFEAAEVEHYKTMRELAAAGKAGK